MAVPVNTIAPVVTPDAGKVGTVFTTTNGTWTNSPNSFAYQWKLNGANVGTNANAYTSVSAGAVTCTVTASNGDGAGTPAVSNIVAANIPYPGINRQSQRLGLGL